MTQMRFNGFPFDVDHNLNITHSIPLQKTREISQSVSITRRNDKTVNFYVSDLYQITMAYAYWKSGKVNDHSVFDLYFRKNPFEGEFTIFTGLDECLRFLENFRYSDEDIEYLKNTLPSGIENEFFEYLRELTAKEVTLYAIEEGSVAFPR